MIDPFLHDVSEVLPLKILAVDWNGDALTLSGDDWSFSTVSAWRVSDAGGVQFGCWDDRTDKKVAALMSLEIIGISSRGSPNSIDPIFKLSDGRVLEIFSTTTLEPWVMYLPDAIYVADT